MFNLIYQSFADSVDLQSSLHIPPWIVATSFLAAFSFRLPGHSRSKKSNIKHDQAELNTLQIQLDATKKDLEKIDTALRATVFRLHTVIDSLPIPALTLNEYGNVVEWNKKASDLFHLDNHQVVDRPLEKILGTEAFRYLASQAFFQAYMNQQPEPVTMKLTLRDGNTVPMKWHISPISQDGKKVIGTVCSIEIL